MNPQQAQCQSPTRAMVTRLAAYWVRSLYFFHFLRKLLQKWRQAKRGSVQFTTNIVTMSLMELWLGLSEWFILWGNYHGMLLNIHSWITKNGRYWVISWLRQIATFFSVMFGWVFFFFTGRGSFTRLFMNLLGFGGLGSIS